MFSIILNIDKAQSYHKHIYQNYELTYEKVKYEEGGDYHNYINIIIFKISLDFISSKATWFLLSDDRRRER